jgi:haloalkane dehalogenase
MMKRFLLISIGAVIFTGCATTTDTQPIYDRYVAQFDAAQPYKVAIATRADGLRVSAREFGAEHRGRAPTLVLMHGFPDNQHLYDLLIPPLARAHHVVSFDFVGWGKSDKPSSHVYNVASQRADLEAVMAHYKLDNVALVLHDLSGQSGIDWALDNPQKTAALVLLNTYYGPMEKLVAPEAIEFYASKGVLRDIAVWGALKVAPRFQEGVRGQMGKFFSNPEARDTFLPIFAHDAPSMRPAFFSATSVLWDEVSQREKFAPRLRAFEKPVHIVFGADDPYLNPDVAAAFRSLFPVGSLQIVKGAGHYVQLDRPEEVSRIVLEKLIKR